MAMKYKSFPSLVKNVYEMDTALTRVEIPQTLNLKGIFGDRFPRSMVENQRTTEIYNRFSKENSLYGMLRMKDDLIDKSPRAIQDGLQKIVDRGTPKEKDCPFCNAKLKTTYEVWGRVESDHSISCTNLKKFNDNHGLVLLKKHHPLVWTYEEFMDAFETVKKLVEKMNVKNGKASVFWDATPAASSSVIHPHLQVVVRPDRHFGHFELMKQAARSYRSHFGTDYFSDIIRIHQILGLSFRYKNSAILANVAPKNDQEIIVLSNDWKEFHTCLFIALRALIDQAGATSFSLGISYDDSFFYGRLITRGPAFSHGHDTGGAENYLASLISYDPYVVIDAVATYFQSSQFSP